MKKRKCVPFARRASSLPTGPLSSKLERLSINDSRNEMRQLWRRVRAARRARGKRTGENIFICSIVSIHFILNLYLQDRFLRLPPSGAPRTPLFSSAAPRFASEATINSNALRKSGGDRDQELWPLMGWRLMTMMTGVNLSLISYNFYRQQKTF